MSVIEASMAIQQTKKQSDLEKRLKILRQQFYGKNEFRVKNNTTNYEKYTAPSGQRTTNSLTDVSYLYQDLLKILIFSGVAIGVQIILYFLINNHIVNIKFF